MSTTKEQQGVIFDLSMHLSKMLRANAMLIVGSIAWWTSHYSLLWNPQITAAYSFSGGFDIRFMLTILGTVISLAVMMFVARRSSDLEFADHLYPYIAFAVLTVLAVCLMAAPIYIGIGSYVGMAGALLSGLGNAFMLIVYGELHARLGYRFLPIIFAIEVASGVAIFVLLSQTPHVVQIAAIAVFALISAIILVTYARASKDGCTDLDNPAIRIDMTVGQFAVLATLAGFTYGLVRTFAIGTPNDMGIHIGMESECLGSLLSALLLIVVFCLQKRQSLFEQCLLFVVPLLATGMLLVSLQDVSVVVPAAINTVGFACFFNLIWYFATILETNTQYHVTFLMALLFLVCQMAQLVGAMVPIRFSSAVSGGLIYLFLLASILLMYIRTKAPRPVSQTMIVSDASTLDSADQKSNEMHAWEQHFDLSPREAEVAMLLMKRTPYKQISAQLFVSENTVKTHVRNIYRKTDVSSREELLEKLRDIAKNG
ncbi:helix-turn-helix transcriptional regulator [Adlercreutzia sp. ZJ138]|uniref:helix-turn-helix transcriptional regulator n=1 Tax=Adlercreutzia sp. ZJ138 TaxID=2709405 RepID=UPI0013EC5036|nr:helix-turn-helix transcriptional regulator [Adlercreutzia sp. ZJ138]